MEPSTGELQTLMERIHFFDSLRTTAFKDCYVKNVVEVAWLLMGEGYPILEDIDGTEEDHDLLECMKLLFAEFLIELDRRLQSNLVRSSNHDLAVALEYGIHSVTSITGPEICDLLQLGVDGDPEELRQNLKRIWTRLLSDFPIYLPDPLISENQGAVLRAIRNWSRWCDVAGVDPAFLIPLMKAV